MFIITLIVTLSKEVDKDKKKIKKIKKTFCFYLKT